MPPVIRPNIRPLPQRAKPLAPRNPNEKFGHSVAPKTNDHWEVTPELRWLQQDDKLQLQQRWKCVQHSQSRVRPVELYYEWWTIPTIIEEKKPDVTT